MNEDFESLLRQQKLSSPPPEWKREILAQLPSPAPSALPTAQVPRSAWREWLWPSPWAWGTMAAIWLALFLGTLPVYQTQPPASPTFSGDSWFALNHSRQIEQYLHDSLQP